MTCPPFPLMRLALFTALGFSAASPLPAAAQEPQDAPAPSRDATQLPPVTVTGTGPSSLSNRQERGYRSRSSAVSGFREQEVLDTPFSTVTITAEVIRDQQARSLVDVMKNDPSITPASDPLWYDRVNVRGFYLGTDATFRDGLGINDQGSIALENKAAVEVNKGLSALRYGATSPGGTINYVVKRPTAAPVRDVSASTDSHGSVGVHVDLGNRFGVADAFGYRVNVAAQDQSSHVEAFEGSKRFISGFFDWQVHDRLTLELDLEHQRLKRRHVAEPNLWWWASVADAQAAFSRLGPTTYASQSWAMEPNVQTYAAVRARYELATDWKLTVAYQDARLSRDQNAGGVSEVREASGEYEASIYYSPDQERNNRALQLVTTGDVSWGGVKHQLAFGYDGIQRDMTWGDGVDRAIGTDNLFDPRGVARPPVGPAEAGPSSLANRSRQHSVFITDDLSLTDQWRLFGGLRHTRIRQFSPDGPSLAIQYDRSAVTPTVGVVFKPTEHSSLYVSYTEGIEQGGVADGTYDNPGALPPLESQQVEMGAKWELTSDALLTAAVFQIDKGLEVERRTSGGGRVLLQDGRQVHRGVEFTAAGQLTPSLKLIAGVAHLDANVKDTDNVALAGKRPQGVAAWQANLFANWALGAWVSGLSVNGGVYYTGKKAIDEENTWMAPGHVRMDLGLKYDQSVGNAQEITYRVTLDNAADKRYLANTTRGQLQFGAPRTVRASASYSF